MTPFVIFALVLTFGYVVYFAVMITLDLHGKKDVQKTDEENFDVSGMAEEEPVAIQENNDPNSGIMTYTEEVSDDGLRVVNPTSNVATLPFESESQSEPEEGTTEEGKTTSNELNESNEDYMEQTDPEAQICLMSDQFMSHLTEKHKRNIEKKNAIDHV